MRDDDSGSIASWLVQQAPPEGQNVSNSPTRKGGSSRSKVKPYLSTADTAESLHRAVSTSSLDSASSAAGGWSPRNAADIHSKPKTRSRKPDRISSGTSQARTDRQGFTAGAELVKESSLLSNASFDSDDSTESRPQATHITSRLSPAKTSRQGSDMSLHSQHSILDPLPEKPTDVVRHRKVFGSTYSVGKLGELPYTHLPRERGSLTQPPWVVAANRKMAIASESIKSEKLMTGGSLVAPITYGHRHNLETSEFHVEQQQPASDAATAQSTLLPLADEETGAEGIPFPLPSETSQFLQSFSLLEPPEPTEAGRNTISPAGVPPAHMHTSHSSIGFQPPSHLVPAVSAGAHAVALLPALLLDLQPHDRQSHGQEWHDPSELPLFDSWRAGALHRHAPSWPQPVAMSDSQLPQHSQTARLALGASAAPAATAFPQQLGELQMDLSQLSSGSHSQDGAAEEEQLPFAVSSSSSRDQGVPSRPSSSGASHTSMQRESVSSSRGFSIMMSGEEVVDLPGAVASQADAWVDAAVPAQGSLDAAAHNGIGHLTSAAVVMEPSNLQSTAEVDAPQLQSVSSQLEANPDAGSELSIGVIGSLHLPVSMVASTLQHRATATVQLPPLPLVSDLPSQLQTQLPAVATAALMPGSQTGLLLPGTGADLLDRPGSSPLPVSKLLRMVSEDQASLLSGLAAQCAAPGGLLGPASAGQMLPEPTWASETAPQPAACSPSGQTVSALTGNPSSSAQQAQHAQRVWRRHTSPRLESSASPSQQASLTSSAPGPISADSPAQSAQAQTSPLRKKLSQFFSPMFGSISPQRAEVQQSNLQQPLLLQTASQSPMHKQQQQQQQNEESECAGRACVQHGLAQHSTAQLPDMQPGIPAAWQPPSLHQPASALLAASQSAALTHNDAGHLLHSPAVQGMARSLSEIVQQLFSDDQLSRECAKALSLQLGGCDVASFQQLQADAHLLQQCLAKLILAKDQLLQHCTDHESAMRQYCMEVDSAMAQQEQRLLGQAANTLRQRDAALSALHRVEEEVQHLKSVQKELHSQLDGPFAEDAHFDKESWSQLFAPIMGHSSRVDFV